MNIKKKREKKRKSFCVTSVQGDETNIIMLFIDQKLYSFFSFPLKMKIM